VSDFIEFEEEFLSHDFQSTDFFRVLLLCKIDLPITTLTDLGKNLEITMSKTSSSLSKVGSLTPQILIDGRLVDFLGGVGRRWICGLESSFTRLTTVDVRKKVKVVVKEV
jgi:hypothetical protein